MANQIVKSGSYGSWRCSVQKREVPYDDYTSLQPMAIAMARGKMWVERMWGRTHRWLNTPGVFKFLQVRRSWTPGWEPHFFSINARTLLLVRLAPSLLGNSREDGAPFDKQWLIKHIIQIKPGLQKKDRIQDDFKWAKAYSRLEHCKPFVPLLALCSPNHSYCI